MGIARASVLAVRQIPFSITQPGRDPPIHGRGICVLDKVTWTNPLRGSRVIETTFSDFTGAIAEDPLHLA